MPLNQITPGVPSRYDTPMLLKRRSMFVSSGTNVTINLQLVDNCGAPENISQYGAEVPGPGQAGAAAVFKIKEVVGPSSPLFSVDMTLTDPAAGKVSVLLPDNVTGLPGVYAAEAGVFDINSKLAFTNKFYVWVDRGLFAANYTDQGPPQADEIRNAMADYDPAYNLLLDDYEQDLTNLCLATERAIRYWNEAQPPVDQRYTTCDWPAVFRGNLLQGTIGYLYQTTAQGFVRNQLSYQAAGVAVDDQNKWQQYTQIGMQLHQQYQEWVKLKKAQLNAEAGVTSFGSPYALYQTWP